LIFSFIKLYLSLKTLLLCYYLAQKLSYFYVVRLRKALIIIILITILTSKVVQAQKKRRMDLGVYKQAVESYQHLYRLDRDRHDDMT